MALIASATFTIFENLVYLRTYYAAADPDDTGTSFGSYRPRLAVAKVVHPLEDHNVSFDVFDPGLAALLGTEE